MRALVAACLALAGLSLLLPSAPSSDAWAWLVWGREVAHLDLSTADAPSWKPLPVVATTALSVFGDAAPELWLVVARAGGLVALVLAYRLGARLGRHPAAGLLAAIALLSADWLRFQAHGEAEPLIAALLLWAVDRHLEGRHAQAYVLAFLAALGRPEVWPLLGAYAVYLWVREPRTRPLVASLAAAVPILWIAPEWWGSGEPFGAGERANTPTPTSVADDDRPFLSLLGRAAELVMLPVLAAAAAAAILAARMRDRARDVPILALAGGAVAWVLVVAAMAELGYTGNARYLFPVACVLCVLAGIGAVEAVRAIGGAADARAAGRGRRVAAAAAALMALVALPFLPARGRALADQADLAEDRDATLSDLAGAVGRAGGAPGVAACGHAAVTRGGFQGALAWELDLPFERVTRDDPPARRLRVRPPATVFDASAASSRARPGWAPPDARIRPIAHAGTWTVFAATHPSAAAAPGCRTRRPP